MKKNWIQKLTVMASAVACVVLAMTIDVNATTYPEQQVAFDKKYEGVFNPDEEYSYRITLPTSGKLSVVMSKQEKASGGKMWMRMEDANGKEYFCEFGWNNGNRTRSFDLLAGDYVMKVNDPGRYCSNPVDFSFVASFEASGETISESQSKKNNAITDAAVYAVGQKVVGQIAKNDDVDVYKFKTPKAGFLTIKYNPSLADSSIRLEDSFGDVSYEENNIEFGQHSYQYFVTKGTYYLSVKRGYDENKTGTYVVQSSISDIPKVKLSSTKNVTVKSIKATYKRNAKVDGYHVQISKKKNFKSGKKNQYVDDSTYNTALISNLKKGTTYYVRVRTYKTDKNSKKYYSAWSNVKSVKIKK